MTATLPFILCSIVITVALIKGLTIGNFLLVVVVPLLSPKTETIGSLTIAHSGELYLKTPIAWFNEANIALMAVIIMIGWKVSGFSMLLFFVGMQAIPQEFYEAAQVDEAGLSRPGLPIFNRAMRARCR